MCFLVCVCVCVFSFSENREDMLSPSNNKLTEVLEEANKLFKDGRCDTSTEMLDVGLSPVTIPVKEAYSRLG